VSVVAANNHFDAIEEDVLHEAWCLIHSDDTEYNNLREVILGETVYDDYALDFAKEQFDTTTDE